MTDAPAFLAPPPVAVGARVARSPVSPRRRRQHHSVVVAAASSSASPPSPPGRPPRPPPRSAAPVSRRVWVAASTAAAAVTAAGLVLPPRPAAAATAGGAPTPGGGAPATSAGVAAAVAEGAAAPLRRDELIFDTHAGSFLPPHPQQLFSRRLVGGGGGAPAGAAPPPTRNPALIDRLVVVGETHTHPTHHRIQLDIIRALHDLSTASPSAAGASAAAGRPVVVGLEQFHRQHTPHLDAYVGGRISLPRLLALTDWAHTWGYPAALYTPLFRYCRAHRVRMVGLNAPAALVAAVARGGLDSLPASVVPYLPEMDLGSRPHFARFAAKMGAMGGGAHHGGGGGGEGGRFDLQVLRHYYEAETLWDEYMAESAAGVLAADPAARLVVLAGTAHVEARDGLPERVERRVGGRAFTVLPTSVRWASAAGTSVPDIDAPLGGGGLADWIWYSPREIDLV